MEPASDDYRILAIRDFGKAFRRRTARILFSKLQVTEEEMKEITYRLWRDRGQDVDQFVTVFFLPGMDTNSFAYAFGSCQGEGKTEVSVEVSR